MKTCNNCQQMVFDDVKQSFCGFLEFGKYTYAWEKKN